jgi:prepilin-type N-terminal cleavage/methylation domain-containing protein
MKIRHHQAFTFLEVLIAVGILGLVLTALLSFFVQVIELNTISRSISLAASHAEYVLEDVRSSSGVLISQIDSGLWDLDTDGEFAAKGLSRLDNEVIDVSHDGATPLTITVTISWQATNGRQEQLTFLTIDSGV